MRHRSSGVEHSIRNRAVVGSNPTGGSRAGVAQLEERNLAKVEVAGSNQVTRSSGVFGRLQFGAWLSPVERCVRDAEVPGSNPGAPTLPRVTRSASRARDPSHVEAP